MDTDLDTDLHGTKEALRSKYLQAEKSVSGLILGKEGLRLHLADQPRSASTALNGFDLEPEKDT